MRGRRGREGIQISLADDGKLFGSGEKGQHRDKVVTFKM